MNSPRDQGPPGRICFLCPCHTAKWPFTRPTLQGPRARSPEPTVCRAGGGGCASFLTPFSTSSMWSQNCMKRLIFQLVLQLTEFT